jgi:hypothetical protein
MGPYLLQQIPSLLGGKRFDQVLLGCGQSRDITEHKHAEEALYLVQEQLLEQQRHEREQAEADLVKGEDQLVPEK